MHLTITKHEVNRKRFAEMVVYYSIVEILITGYYIKPADVSCQLCLYKVSHVQPAFISFFYIMYIKCVHIMIMSHAEIAICVTFKFVQLVFVYVCYHVDFEMFSNTVLTCIV